MTSLIERTVQNVFDDERKNDDRIEELEDDIRFMQQELKNCKKKVKILKTERKGLQIDLLKEKKLKWIECNLNEWREYIENNDETPLYHIYCVEGSVYQQGYYKGVCELNRKDEEHFDKYFNDYFYYGYPNYQDVNDPHHDGSECYLAFGGGGAYVKTIEWD